MATETGSLNIQANSKQVLPRNHALSPESSGQILRIWLAGQTRLDTIGYLGILSLLRYCWNSGMAKILIVDDSVFARDILGLNVKRGGHEVVGFAGDGEQALKMFKSRHPELVILDYLMAGKNGMEVLEEIITHDPNARVIMVSGSGDHTVEERALRAGAKVFMGKPCVQSELLNEIERVMEI